MPLIQYAEPKFRATSLRLIAAANEILREYVAQGFVLTVRQLYYQFVSRGMIENNMKEYKRIVRVVGEARLGGLIDWDHIIDRTRGMRSRPTWQTPAEIIASAASQFIIDKWAPQKHRVLVMIEKDALVGVIEPTCNRLQIPYLSCRGYVSLSEMWQTALRMQAFIKKGRKPVVLHFGDHDPSGIDMSRDILDRLDMFRAAGAYVRRVALNMNQVEEYDPPPNPAKETDSRSPSYIARFGDESWELDALDPKMIAALIEEHVAEFRDPDLWSQEVAREAELIKPLRRASARWPEVVAFLES